MKRIFIRVAVIAIAVIGYTFFQFFFLRSEINKNIRNLSTSIAEENEKLSAELEGITQRIKQLETGLEILAAAGSGDPGIDDQLSALKRDIEKTNARLRSSMQLPEKKEARQTPVPASTPLPQAMEKEPEPDPTPVPVLAGLKDLARDDVKLGATYSSGLKAFEKGEYTAARAAFSQLLELNPPVWEIHLYYLWSAYYENPARAATDRGLATLLKALPAEYNKTGERSKLQGLFALEQGNWSRGVQYLEEALTQNPKDAETLLALGECFIQVNDTVKAHSVLNDILSLFPGSPEAVQAGELIELIKGVG